MRLQLFVLLAILLPFAAQARELPKQCTGSVDLCIEGSEATLPLILGGKVTTILIDDEEPSSVQIAVQNLRSDLETMIESGNDAEPSRSESYAVIVGTLDHSPIIQELVASGKLDGQSLRGEWEAYLQTMVDDPAPGIDRALIIAGSDERGAIYGVYDLLERAGMSPWHYWADVPPARHEALFVSNGTRTDAPEVRYRGIFLNDENPALYGFATDTFGGFNAQFYEKVFDLVLRLKGNFIWPAMWGKAFYDDDPQNGALAERMGIVIGTSHHEPMMRAHIEWERHGDGPWNYETNADGLRSFWRGGMERVGDGETLVTVGMRGDGDEAMTEGTAIPLLERIVQDQRRIIADVSGRPANETPQVWALYKEVQDYFDQGMEVPDDVTLLFADDNWGNIRRLPQAGDERAGGYGVYYHFDYVGGPRNYKWLNVTQIERTWQQMDLAWDRGADRLWIVNVGDLKPMELPISFFLAQAWDPSEMTHDRMDRFARDWAADIFGQQHADEIGELLERSVKLNARRKPELLDADTYDLRSGEWAEVAAEYRALAERADRMRGALSEPLLDAYDQLVWFPIQAMSNLYRLYHAVAMNRALAADNDPSANEFADLAEAAFERDRELTAYYHEEIAGGKWNHMMSQTHIGYTYWQQPDEQVMPDTVRIDQGSGQASGAASVSLPGPSPAPQSFDGSEPLPFDGEPLALSAEQLRCRIGGRHTQWTEISNLGRRGDALALTPDHGGTVEIDAAPSLRMPLMVEEPGPLTVRLLVSPSFDVDGTGGLHYSVSIGGEMQLGTLDLRPDTQQWNRAVSEYSVALDVSASVEAGRQEIDIRFPSPSLVLQEVHLFRGEEPQRYLGPPLANVPGGLRC